jgi:hypothetical protein
MKQKLTFTILGHAHRTSLYNKTYLFLHKLHCYQITETLDILCVVRQTLQYNLIRTDVRISRTKS